MVHRIKVHTFCQFLREFKDYLNKAFKEYQDYCDDRQKNYFLTEINKCDKLIYQLEYLQADFPDVVCMEVEDEYTVNEFYRWFSGSKIHTSSISGNFLNNSNRRFIFS